MGEKRCRVIMVAHEVLLKASRVPCRGGFTASKRQAEILWDPRDLRGKSALPQVLPQDGCVREGGITRFHRCSFFPLG